MFNGFEQIQYFNPRTRVECDESHCADQINGKNFNPRTRVECDHVPVPGSVGVTISIHALV